MDHKPADLDPESGSHCIQLISPCLVSYCFKKVLFGINTVRAKLSCLCIICLFGARKFSLYSIMGVLVIRIIPEFRILRLTFYEKSASKC